jgi:transcriptional regulator with GAF, ATPase, and Fis domain
MFERVPAPDKESGQTRRWASPLAFPGGDRHQASRALHLSIDHLPNAVLIVGDSGEVLASNRAADAIFMAGAGQLSGRRVDDLMPELSVALGGDSWQRFCERPQTRSFGSDRPLAGVRADSSVVPLEIALKVIVDGGTPHVVASLGEVTDRVLHDTQLAAAAANDLRLQRAIADLAARLVTVDVPAIDETIVDGLHRIADTLKLDEAILWPKPASGIAPYFWARTPRPSSTALEMSSLLLIAAKLDTGETSCFTRLDDLPSPRDREMLRRQGLRSVAVIPVEAPGGDARARGALAFTSRAIEHDWERAVVEQLRIVAGVLAQALARKAAATELQHSLDEMARLREERVSEDQLPRPRVSQARRSLIVCEGPALRPALAQVEQVAATPATVLLLGETGVGKEIFAEAIHALSPRSHRPMVRVSCAAIPSALIESELFGRERGAFTGALTRQIGRFEAAHQSTLFLDEIGDLPAEVQVKLLRVLQERVIERLGSLQSIKVDVRIIAATNRNLEQAVQDKTFREDLFYRLNVFPITVPPLRDRAEDVPALAWEFVDEFSKAFGKPIESISKDSMRQLQQYQWPGNVRELRNLIERAVILATGPCLAVPVPETGITRLPASSQTLRSLELDHIRTTLENTNWRVRGHGGAAERLGLKPTTLEGRMAKLGLTRPARA